MSYIDNLYNTLSSHEDTGFSNSTEFENHIHGLNKQERDKYLRNVWNTLNSSQATEAFESYPKLRNNVDIHFAPGYGSVDMPDRYSQFEDVGPIGDKYVVHTSDGFKYIKKGEVEIGAGWDTFYDVQAVTSKNGSTYPILNISDYVGNKVMTDTRAWTNDEAWTIGDPIEGYTSNHQKKTIGMKLSDNMVEMGGGVDLLQETRNQNSIFYSSYGDIGIDDQFAEHVSSNAHKEMHEFAVGFGPFRHALNKSMYDISNDEFMIPLAEEYSRVYKKILKSTDDKDYAQSLALKTVFFPAIEKKLTDEEVVIPQWFDGAMQNSWMNYNLGITVPELNREALMFHNDGFKRIIDSFSQYAENGTFQSLHTGVPWESQITVEDYTNPEIYSQKMGSHINAQLNKLSKGMIPNDEDSYNSQKMLVQSIIMQDMMNQTRMVGDFGNFIPPGAFWLIGNKNSPRWLKALKDPHLRRFLPFGMKYKSITAGGDWSKYDKPTRKALVKMMESGGVSFNNMIDLEADGIAFTRYKDRRIVPNINRVFNSWTTTGEPGRLGINWTAGKKIPVSKLFCGYAGAAQGLPKTMDIIGGTLSGYGWLNSDWSPKSRIGKDFFDAMDIWEADPGERNWFSKESDWEQAWFLEDNLIGVRGMFGYDTFMRNTEDFKSIHSDAQVIFNGISEGIVHGYNKGLSSKISLTNIGIKIQNEILNDPEYLALKTDEEKKEFYTQKFYERAFTTRMSGNRKLGDNTYIKNGLYQEILADYVEGFNAYEGGLSLINKLRVGNEANTIAVRDIPPPPGFPQELWNEMKVISTMSDEEYYNTYPNSKRTTKKSRRFIDLKDGRNAIFGSPTYTRDVVHGSHPLYSVNDHTDNFDYNIFNRINTSLGTVYENRYLFEVNDIIDDWIENVTQTKKSIEKIRKQRKWEQTEEGQEYLLREQERNKLRQIMMNPVSTKVDIENFVNNSLYLQGGPYTQLLKDLEALED